MIILENPAARGISAEATWSEISREQLPYWNDLLLRTGAPVHQYPFWNEAYERLYFSPRHLVWGRHHDPKAYVCILSVGFRGFRVGLVFRGPANLKDSAPVPHEALAALSDWAAHEGYVFLRLTPQDQPTLATAASVKGARTADFFPFYLDYGLVSPELVVDQQESDEAMLASFDREARRKIRRAQESNYEIRTGDSVAALSEVWPLYAQCVQRKGFRLERPLSFYADLVRAASCHDAVRIYSAWRNDQLSAMTFVVRDRDTAHCLLAANSDDGANSGASALLHWSSMRHMYRLGARAYNMGSAPGSLARFKNQFSPRELTCPGAVSLVVDEKRFRLWQSALLPLAKAVRPQVRKLSGKLYQNKSKVAAAGLERTASMPAPPEAARRTA